MAAPDPNPVSATEEVAKSDAPPPQEKPETTPAKPRPREIGGPSGPEPTRYGDWERNGRVSDF